MSDNSISFECQIIEVKSRTSVSQDKVGRLVIEFLPTDEVLDGLNKLHRTDKQIVVAVAEIKQRTTDYNG